jgi:hypothetical protein
MKVVFDPDFDGGSWPGPLNGRSAVAGEAWVGEAGLLGLLETTMGLGGPAIPASRRVASLVPAVRSVDGFWSASAEVDPFATARRLLSWRDFLHSSADPGSRCSGGAEMMAACREAGHRGGERRWASGRSLDAPEVVADGGEKMTRIDPEGNRIDRRPRWTPSVRGMSLPWPGRIDATGGVTGKPSSSKSTIQISSARSRASGC